MTSPHPTRRALRESRADGSTAVADDLSGGGAARRPAKGSRAGRNLPAAIAVGATLGLLIVLALALAKVTFLVLVAVAVAAGVWELRRALAQVAIHVPLVPSLVGSLSMLGCCLRRRRPGARRSRSASPASAVLLWRVADGVADAMRDIAGGMFVAALPVLPRRLRRPAPRRAGRRREAGLRVHPRHRAAATSGATLFGVLWGRHPMAPSVSPKKSWEGFAGSVGLPASVGGVPGHLAGPRRALVERAHPRGPRRGRRDRRRPHRVDHQARPRDQGHGQRSSRATAGSWTGWTRCSSRPPLIWALLSVFVPLA